MIEKLIKWFNGILEASSLPDKLVVFIENATIIIVTLALAILADFILKRIIISSITKITQKTRNTWDDILVKRGVFNHLAHLGPAIIIYNSLDYIFDAPGMVSFLKHITQTSMVIIVLMVLNAILDAILEIYRTLPISKGREIKGYLQVIKIIFYSASIIIIISIFSIQQTYLLRMTILCIVLREVTNISHNIPKIPKYFIVPLLLQIEARC